MSALTNTVIGLFRLQDVTKITSETRYNAAEPSSSSLTDPSDQAKQCPRL
jgi:hypothetical protein